MKSIITLMAITLSVSVSAGERAKMAILEPTSKVVVAGQKESTTVQETASRVIPRLIQEATTKFKPKWDNLEFVPYESARAAQREIIVSYSLSGEDLMPPSLLKTLAQKLQCRYIVQSVVFELTGARSERLTRQRTGRIVIDLYVYDAQEGKYVWHDSRTQTSIRTDWGGTASLREVQDQAMLNAFREGLEPFVVRGERKVVAVQTSNLIATVKSVIKETGTVLLDIGASAKVYVGMEFISLDGKCRIRVKEVLANGSLADIVEGTPEPNQTFKSVD